MSIADIIGQYLTTPPGELFLVSPRRALPFANTVALAGGAQVSMAISFPLEALAPNDGIWLESWTGLLFGDAVAGSTFTVNSFTAELNTATPNFVMVLGQPTFTILTASGSAAAVPEITFSISFATPWLSLRDITNAAYQVGRQPVQPLELDIAVSVLNGAAASHLTVNSTLLYRKVSGVEA
jgi:hypothetical protein